MDRWLRRIIPLFSLSCIYSFYPLIHCNILLFLDVNIINSGLNNIIKGEASSIVLSVLPLYFCNITWWWPKHVACIRNKWMLQHLCCCIGLMTICACSPSVRFVPCLAQCCRWDFFGIWVEFIKSDKLFVVYIRIFILLPLPFCLWSPVT